MNSFQDYYNYNRLNMPNEFNNSNKITNNMNYNKCTYNQSNISINDIFDPYNGFIRGNMFPDLYNQYKINNPYKIEPMNEQAQMLTTIDALCFSAHDLNLYLDTHPNDRDMIQLFNQYRMQSVQAINEYENRFGPLTISSNALNRYPWTWDNMPWPWENN